MGHLEDAACIGSSYKELSESVSNSFYQLEDAAQSLRNELDDLRI